MSTARLELLGGFAICGAGSAPVPIRISSKKAVALVAYLAMRPNRSAGREQLATLLWGDSFDKQARHSLRECLRQLRRDLASIAPDLLHFDGDKIGLPTHALTVDADAFAALARSADPEELERAAALYRGDFLAELSLRAEAFDDWADGERSRLQAMAAEVFERCAERFDGLGDGRRAVDAATRLVALDPLREDWQQYLLRLLARFEGRDAAMAHARALTARLKRELDVEPTQATKALVAEIGQSAIAPAMPIGASTAPPLRRGKPLLAVLPFLDLRQGRPRDHLSDGIAIDIIAVLSWIRSLSVVAHRSSFFYRDGAAEVRQIGRELGVDYVLEGSVRRLNDCLRITAQLVDATTGDNVWAERYDAPPDDRFIAQDEIATKIAACVEPQIYAAEGRRARSQPLPALDVRGCTMRAFALINLRSRQNYETAKELLRRAIHLDPHCTQAHSLLAYVTALDVVYGWKPRETAMPLARDAANTAVLIDVDAPWAHLALGFVHAQSRATEEAICEFEKALALNPSFSLAHTYLGSALSHLGRTEAALEEIDIAERLNPRQMFFGVNNYVRANAHFAAERYRGASFFARRSVRESPGIVTSHRQLVVNCMLAGEGRDAKAALDVLLRLVPGMSLGNISEALPYSRERDRSRFLDAFSRMGLE